MGKDQEFLDAARSGNISLVEKFLSQKAKRAGPLASLRRGPGVNVQDSGGYSALHHACINGHTDIVRLLLANEASPNLPDSRGSSPLHLAAWAGHQEIVRMLLTHPYRPGNPNLQTIENETPLHCAAQHGHTGALAVLLSHDADPNMRNTRGETPLDLAAQYGRLQAVQMLIRAHPELIEPFSSATIEGHGGGVSGGQHQHLQHHTAAAAKSRHSSPLPHSGSVSTPSPSSPSMNSSPATPSRNIFPHTCLHLASRNGHKNVVEVLLAAGVCVNLLTPSGTALHEAALCGKESVVKTLLRANIDLNATDAEGRTALDILKEFPPHVTKHIVAVINNFRNQMETDECDEVIYRHHNAQQQQRNANSSGVIGGGGSGGQHYHQSKQQHSSSNHYHFNSNAHLLNNSHSMQQAATHGKQQRYSSAFITTGGGKSLDSCLQPDDYCGGGSSSEVAISPSSSMSSFEPTSVSPRSRASTGGIAGFGNNATPHLSSFVGPPKKPPRRNLSVSPTHAGQQFSYTSPNHQQQQVGNIRGKQHRSPSNDSPYGYHQSHGSVGGISFDETQMRERQRNDRLYASARESTRSATGISMSSSNDMLEKRHCINEDYDENTVPTKMQQESSHSMKRPLPAPRNIAPISKDIINCENPILKSYNPNRKLKRNRNSCSLSIGDKEQRSMSSDSNSDPKTQIPLSPTNYQQPPTPDHPPPSSKQAERTIHERIRPLSMEYKRRSALLLQQKHLMIDSSTSPLRNPTYPRTFPPPPPQYGNDCEPMKILTPNPERLINASGIQGSTASIISSSSSASEHSASSNCVEEFIGDAPFAGLFKGSRGNGGGPKQQQQQRTRPPISIKPAIPERKFVPTPKVIEPIETTNNSITNNESMYKNVHDVECNNHNTTTTTATNNNNSHNQHNNNNHNSNSKDDQLSHQSFNSVGADETLNNESSNEDGMTLANSQEGSILSPFNAEEARKKISEIIESFGSGILNTNITPTHDIELDFDDLDVTAERHELAVRLRSAGLLHLERMLFENGYDNYKFVNGVFEENDVKLMHIPDVDAIKLIRFVNTLPKAEFQAQIQAKTQQQQVNKTTTNNTNDETKGVSTLSQWLHSIQLPEYIEFFNKHLYNTIDSVCGVWDVELQTVLEINKLGHRRRILSSLTYIRQMRGELKIAKTPLGENTEINKMATSNGGDKEMQPKIQATTTQQPTQQTHRSSITGYRKNRPAPQPPIAAVAAANKTEEAPLQIRAPSELLLDLPTDLRTKWRHSANALLNEQIKYEVSYLGSTVVKELRGTESTRKSIEKLKRIIEKANANAERESNKRQKNKLARNSMINKPRQISVCLAISYRGVEFINMENRLTICEHEIQNINCACQDSDDLKHFAYITKENDQHYCHVFQVESTDLATEIILTLGQAFEVAYQLALRDGITNTPNAVLKKNLIQGSETIKLEP